MPNFQQNLFIENYNLLADELRAIGITIKTLDPKGTCLGDSFQYAFFAHNQLKHDFYIYKDFITQLTPESITIIVDAYQKNKKLRVQSRKEDASTLFSFYKLVSFFEGMSIAQRNNNFKDIGAYWLDSISAPCTPAKLVEILKFARIKKQRFIGVDTGFHQLMIEVVSDKEFYVYDPNNNDKVKPLISEKAVADQLLNFVKEWKNSNKIIFGYDFISFEKDELFFNLINDHENIINQYQLFQELIIRCQLGLICQKETVLLLIENGEELKKTDLSQQLIDFLADLQAYLAQKPSPLFAELHAVGGSIDVNATIYTNKIHWLYVAAAHGQLSIVKELITAGANVNAKSDDTTPLFVAAQNGHVEIVRALIAAGANIETPWEGATPLFQAALNGHTDVVRVLIAAGANIATMTVGATPLFIAAQNGHTEVVSILIEAGANIETTGTGATPLFQAAQNGHAEVVRALIAAGANVDSKSDDTTPLFIAAQNGHIDVVRVLIAAGADIEAMWDGATPLFQAAHNGHTEVVKALIKAKANVETPWEGGTPLFQAAYNGHTEVVKALIKAKANVETPWKGRTPLFQAALSGHIEIVRALIAAGANIERTWNGATPLFQAAQNGHTETVQALINAGANMETPYKGRTPLFQAAQNGRTEVVKALIAAGANIKTTWNGQTLLFVAMKNGRTDIVKILLAQRFKNMTKDNIKTILNKFVNNNEKLFSELVVERLCDHLFEQVEKKNMDPADALKILQVATKHDLFKQKGFISLFSESKSHAILVSAQRRFQQLEIESRLNVSNNNSVSCRS